MKRGEIRLVVAQGDHGKPRPAVIIQSDAFNGTHPSIAVCPMTSLITNAPLVRIGVEPNPGNGLKKHSQIMLDKVASLRRSRVGDRIGALDASTLGQVDRALAVFLGLAG